MLVGNFDRPNLTYRVLPRHDLCKQVLEVIDRHPGEAGIIYCIRRSDVDELAGCPDTGYKALPYHAGLTPTSGAARPQDAFAAEECDIVVATVAFGMGIDRSNVRFVLHTRRCRSRWSTTSRRPAARRSGSRMTPTRRPLPSWRHAATKNSRSGSPDR